MPIKILDTETTGVSKQDQIIQLASISISQHRHELLTHKVVVPLFEQHQKNSFEPTTAIKGISNKFFNPSVPINRHAQEVHGISKLRLLKEAPVSTFRAPEMDILIAHNASFDTRLISQTDSNFDKTKIKIICTISLAKKIEKISGYKFGFDNYQLKSIFLFFYPELVAKYETQLHDALGDCEMTLLILIKLWENFPFIGNIYDLYDYIFVQNGKN